MCFILLNLGDFCHHFFVSCLIFALIDCLVAEMLIGSCRWRNVGRLFSGLEPYSAASLAKASALSLPIEFLCAATQVKDSEVLWVASVSFRGRCTRSCLRSSSRNRFNIILLFAWCFFRLPFDISNCVFVFG